MFIVGGGIIPLSDLTLKGANDYTDFLLYAEVVELADTRVSEARPARGGGSTPPLRSFLRLPNRKC